MKLVSRPFSNNSKKKTKKGHCTNQHEPSTCGDKINHTNQNMDIQQTSKLTILQKKNINAELQPQPIQFYNTQRKLMIDDVSDHRQHMLEMQNLLAKLKNDQKPEHTAIQMNNNRLI